MKGSNISSILLRLVLVIGSASIGYAQDLEPPRVEMPPIPIADSSVLDDISNRMTSGLQPERDASPTILAGNQLRRIVIELAARGRGDDEVAAIAALEAIRLSEAIGGLTRRMDRLNRSGEQFGDPPRPLTDDERSQAMKRLETFHRIALDELRRRPRSTVADLDDTMSLVLAPIRDVIETVELRLLQDHWPLQSVVMQGDAALVETEDPEADRSLENHDATTRIAAEFKNLESLPHVRQDQVERLLDISVAIDQIEEPDIRSSLLHHQTAIVEIMIQAGSFSTTSIDRQLQATARKIENRHHRDTRAVINDLDRMTNPPRTPEETDLKRLGVARNSADDLQRLEQAGEIIDQLSRIQPSAGRQFFTRMRQLTRQLADERTRLDAARRFDQIATDLDRFTPLSVEVLLVDPDDQMEELVAGRSADLVNRIELSRRIWAEEIANGETNGPGRRSLLDLERLGRMLADAKSMADDDPDIMRRLNGINRWGGWYVSNDTIGWAARTIAPGLRLAATAAAEGDFERLARDVQRLELQSPPARLVAWFSSNLAGTLSNLEGGSVGALATVSIPPTSAAWGLEHRVSIARICRGFAELSAARQRGDSTEVEKISGWVTGACDELLQDISSSGPASPAGISRNKETDA